MSGFGAGAAAESFGGVGTVSLAGRGAGGIGRKGRGRGGLRLLHRHDHGLAAEPAEDELLPPDRAAGPEGGVRGQRVREGRHEQGGLIHREPRRRPPEVPLARGFHSPEIRPQLDDVQVQLEDPRLAQRPLEAVGGHRLLQLPQRVARGREVQVLGELLGDRAGAAHPALPVGGAAEGPLQFRAIARIPPREGAAPVAEGLADRPPVDPVVLVEGVVLARDRRFAEPLRDRVEGNGPIGERRRVARRAVLACAHRLESGPCRPVGAPPRRRRPHREEPDDGAREGGGGHQEEAAQESHGAAQRRVGPSGAATRAPLAPKVWRPPECDGTRPTRTPR